MKRIFFYFTAVALSITTLTAQQQGPSLSWDENNIDFGDIKEADGKVTKRFTFKNTGNQPLVITSVRPTCGCTSSDYTKEPVSPGSKGFVDATYNPAHRPGKFSKSINVVTNADPANTTIRFHGNVIPKPKTLEDKYPQKIGILNLESKHLAMMKVSSSEKKTDTIKVANTTTNNINIDFRNVPAHLTVQASPKVLKPEQTGSIIITYDATKINDWGFIMDKITVALNNDTDKGRNTISVSANINEDFSKLSEKQKANAPKASVDNTVFNFGSIKQGDKSEHSFIIKNEGKTDLIIRKIKPSCGCTIVSPSTQTIKPGKSANLDVIFNSAGKNNKQNNTITVITNDPNNSQISLRITGTVNIQ